MHFHLDNNISDEEIIAVVKQLSSEKSPGPDGYIGVFFKQCWDIIGHDVTIALRVLFPSRTNAGTYSTRQTSLS
jgi:hypothetical protein